MDMETGYMEIWKGLCKEVTCKLRPKEERALGGQRVENSMLCNGNSILCKKNSMREGLAERETDKKGEQGTQGAS